MRHLPHQGLLNPCPRASTQVQALYSADILYLI